MTYPKPIMSLAELRQMGFSREYLLQMCHRRGQKYATQLCKNGKFIIDTEKFERARQNMIRD